MATTTYAEARWKIATKSLQTMVRYGSWTEMENCQNVRTFKWLDNRASVLFSLALMRPVYYYILTFLSRAFLFIAFSFLFGEWAQKPERCREWKCGTIVILVESLFFSYFSPHLSLQHQIISELSAVRSQSSVFFFFLFRCFDKVISFLHLPVNTSNNNKTFVLLIRGRRETHRKWKWHFIYLSFVYFV